MEKKGSQPYCRNTEDIPDNQIDAIDPISLIKNRILQLFYGTANLDNIFQTGENNENKNKSSALYKETLKKLTIIQI